jgi:hypothetical protein
MVKYSHCLWVFLLVSCGGSESNKDEIVASVSDNTVLDCAVCERMYLFNEIKELVLNKVWLGLDSGSLTVPLLYFNKSHAYMTFGDDEIFKHREYETIECNENLFITKLSRLDTQPFHMENKMSFTDATSIYYYRPMMLCSDVETMHEFVPDFSKTEDWLQLVMHEYFHSIQFSHPATINYLAKTIKIPADTLDKIYTQNQWYQQELKKENDELLKAIESTTKDSLKIHIKQFFQIRENRRKKYETMTGQNLRVLENFWETIEGTARYVEYYMAGNFNQIANTSIRCDTLFHNFEDYNDELNFEDKPQFRKRTEMMTAYHYVTGFNLCRLMDKMKINYKHGLFNSPQRGLYELLLMNAKH